MYGAVARRAGIGSGGTGKVHIMSRKMLINASHPEENRVAIVVDGILSELDIELAGQQQTKGNIYKAVVARVEPGLQAAFVDYGAEKHGFLQIGEIHPQLHPKKKESAKDRPRINDILHRGQEILVQVVKGERGTKGAALTTYLSLPGRYMVLMPDSDTKGVSRKIQDDKERKTLKKTMARLDLPNEMGYIVRTAGIGKEESELKRDFNYLVSLYKGILAHKEKVKAPAQLYQESDIVIRSIRDYFATDMDEVLIDDPKVYQQARDFFSLVMPEQLHLVKQHREKRPIFSRYQIEEQIDALSRNQVQLPSGGSIVIDQTEALVAIDVNSGRMAGEKGIEATAARSNIEAAAEIGRQLRLRDLGGLIVIDFIDMRDRKKIREVEQTLTQSVKDDKARITLGRISQFGLLEMSRQRIRPTLSVGAYLECPHCQGKGRIKSPEAQAVALLRQLHAAVSKGQIGTIEANVPLDVANYLLNERRAALSDLESRFDLKILIYGSTETLPEQTELELRKREKPAQESSDQGPISHAIGLEEALAAISAPEDKVAETENISTEEVAEELPQPTEGEESGEGKSKRRRRRRRRRGGSDAKTDAATQDANDSEAEQEGELPVAEAEKTEAPTEEPKRSRRRGRRSAAKKTDDAPVADETANAEQTAETVEAAPGTETAPVTAEKPKRRRRSTTKKTDESAATAQNDVPATTAEPVAVEQPALTSESTSDVEAKPKRRRRKPAAKKTEETANPDSVVDTSAPAQEAGPPQEIEEKPKRRPRKTTAKKTETAAVETSPVKQAVITEEKPKRRTRKPAAKKVTANTETPPPTEQAPATSEEKPKRRTRKPVEKKTEDTAAAAQAPEQGSSVTEEKPKRRARKPAAKKVEDKTAVTPVAEKAPASEEKPKRRTGKPAAKRVEE